MIFYGPSDEALSRLSGDWCASYSGGKDSTSLVTWVEWLRRTGQIAAPAPRLVMSDTGVEYPDLGAVAADLMVLLRASGWHCEVVRPLPLERLYVRILGVGVTPIHPGVRRMRWCTRSTKIGPMDRWWAASGGGLVLTGVRMGESEMRDSKLRRSLPTCAAGGECGLPAVAPTTYAPILHWRTCQVIDWLSGAVAGPVRAVMADVFAVTRRLVEVYGVTYGQPTFSYAEPDVITARFGCVGCPAIGAEAAPPASVIRRHGPGSAVGELYAVWFDARRRANRCYRPSLRGGRGGYGPIRMPVRSSLLDRVKDIQRRAGLELVTVEDEAAIRDCWVRKVYPRGWSEADEAVRPSDVTLFGPDAEGTP